MSDVTTTAVVRALCPKRLSIRPDPGTQTQWLIGSPFFPPFTILSTIKSLHDNISEESESLLSLLPKGLHVIGALVSGTDSPDPAIAAARELRKALSEPQVPLVAAVDGGGGGGVVRFFVESNEGLVEAVDTVVYEESPEKFVRESGCLVRCCLPFRVPVYLPVNNDNGNPSDEFVFLVLCVAYVEVLGFGTL